MYIELSGFQTITIPVSEERIPIQHYLRQPQRLVNALTDSSRIEILGENLYRLKMRPLTFITISVQPTVDLQVWAEPSGRIRLKSLGCEIRGVSYVNQRFHFGLSGHLQPEVIEGQTQVKGRADIAVAVDVPLPLSLTPKPILEATGNSILKSILLSIKQRLGHQLVQDYRHWVATQASTHPPSVDVQGLSPHSSGI